MKNLRFLLYAGMFLVIFSCREDDDSTPTPTPQPIAGFDISNAIPEAEEQITFTNTSENATSYEWDFGDGNMSTETNPTHQYAEVGNYTVKLVASNDGLDDSIEKSVEVVIPVNIYPGEKIRGLSLGEIWGSVKDMAGYDFTEYGPINLNGVWFHPVGEESMGITFFLRGTDISKSDSDYIVLVSVESPFIGITEEGIGLGSTLAEMKNAYGDEDEMSGDNYRYTSLGVDFTISSSEIEEIAIYLP